MRFFSQSLVLLFEAVVLWSGSGEYELGNQTVLHAVATTALKKPEAAKPVQYTALLTGPDQQTTQIEEEAEQQDQDTRYKLLSHTYHVSSG